MDKISILVPCCNVEQYVRECLESIKNQTYSNLEIICIDDGSKDSTGDIIDEYVAADSRFKVIHKPNSGYGDSMNKGLDMCTGDYIGIVESDDWIEPDMFEVLHRTAKEHDLDLVRCCWFEGPTGTERVNDQDFVKKNVVYRPWDEEKVFLQQPSIWVSLYRSDLIEGGRKVRFLPTPGASYQDSSFAFKAYTKSRRFMMIDKPLHHYRINPSSSVSASTNKVCCIVDEWEEMLRWILEDSDMRNDFSRSSLLAKICRSGMMWNYQRLSRTVLKLIFLRRASQFYRKAYSEKVLLLPDYAKKSGRDVVEVMEDPLQYHRSKVFSRMQILAKHDVPRNNNRYAESPLVSIVVTCFNTAKYIQSCLLSILQQDYTNIEVICVDDCSTDDTEVLVRHMMRKDKRIQWISTGKNSGPSIVRNLGNSHCHGDYVIYVDGDDCLLPGAIGTLFDAMSVDDDVVVAGAILNYEEGKNAYTALLNSDKNYYTIKQSMRFNAFQDIKTTLGIHVSAWAKLWRMSVIREYDITFPPGKLYEDEGFFWKYLLVAPRIHSIKSPVYLYQRHLSGSIMSSSFMQKSGMGKDHIYILDDIFKFAVKNHLESVVREKMPILYSNYFWYAYNWSPKEDYQIILEKMCSVLKESGIDTSKHPVLEYLKTYDEVDKAEIFMEAYNGKKEIGVDMSPTAAKLTRKLKKYRKLTKILAVLSAVLLILLLVAIIL